MDVVTSQRWMLGSLNFICGCFYITPLKPLFLPGIPWSLLLDINGTFLHHTRGWTFLLDTMVVVTGLLSFLINENTLGKKVSKIIIIFIQVCQVEDRGRIPHHAPEFDQKSERSQNPDSTCSRYGKLNRPHPQ